MRNRRTRFKSIVITGRTVRVFIKVTAVFLCLAAVFGITRFAGKRVQTVAFSDSFYKTVISSQLHNEEEKISIGKIISAALGFDFGDSKSIIAKAYPMINKDMIPEPTPEPTAQAEHKAEEAQQGEEKPIAETKVQGEMKISNLAGIEVNANALANEPLGFSIKKGNEPQILIVHTHTTESYTNSDTNTYITSESDRNLDESKNIVAVGNAMEEVFKSAGIAAVHDRTVHDYPSFNGAYTRSLATVRANLDAHPGIKIVLDVHRDGIVREDGTKVKVAADINGEKTAQCMFVIGSNAKLTHDNWQENLKLACKVQRLANEMYPGLMRPIILRGERFNQQASTGSVIIEVGSNGNTLEEAVRGGSRIAEVIAKLLVG